ncbi:MAG TPA: substrate-binding domain-containing protein [Solirubrobacterales bacterium]|nr:substrate-binding domain-containing protein [Solirubrobacterales bacterium]
MRTPMRIASHLLAGAAFLCIFGALLASPALAAPPWSAPVYISAPGGSVQQPHVVLDSDGDALTVWERFNIGATKATIQSAGKEPGGAWGTPLDLSAVGQTSVNPQIATNADGDAVAVWGHFVGPITASELVVQGATKPAGGAWSAPFDLTAPGANAYDATVAINGDGEAVAIWGRSNGSHRIVQAALMATGGAWSPTVDLSSPGQNAFAPKVAFNDSGDAVVLWQRSNGSNEIIQAASKAGGGAWGAPVNLSVAGRTARNAEVALDPAGNAVAVWARFDGANDIVQSASRPAGGSWSAPVDLSAPGGAAGRPQIALQGNGYALSIWSRFNGTHNIVQAASRPSGGSWSAPVDLSAAGGTAGEAALAVNAAGDATAVWQRHNGTYQIVQAATRKPAGIWSAPVNLSASDLPSVEPDVAIDESGDAIAIWRRYNGLAQVAEFSHERPLTVTKAGTGTGTVKSSPSGIKCGITCKAEFDKGREVELKQVADAGSKFLEWTGACSGSGSCKVTMSAAREVTAVFAGVTCFGSNITGAGSSLQEIAQSSIWKPGFEGSACNRGTHPTISYEAIGSGGGLSRWNADGVSGEIDTAVGYVATDVAPSAGQIANIKSAAGGAQVAVIPVAETAIAILANPPTGCTVEVITNGNLAAVMAGRISNWSKVEGSEGECNAAITRVVPKDASGATSQFKSYLFALDKTGLPCTAGGTEGKMSWQEMEPIGPAETPNISWPETCPERALSAVVRPAGSGDDELVATINATAGSIGYAALPAAKDGATGTTAILELQNNGQKAGGEASFADPADGVAANCSAIAYKVPKINGGLDIDWSGVFGARPSVGGGNYPLCMLTYDLAFHGYGAAGFGEGQAITATDYLNGYVVQSTGQAAINSHFYSSLPSSPEPVFDVLGAARRAAKSISY